MVRVHAAVLQCCTQLKVHLLTYLKRRFRVISEFAVSRPDILTPCSRLLLWPEAIACMRARARMHGCDCLGPSLLFIAMAKQHGCRYEGDPSRQPRNLQLQNGLCRGIESGINASPVHLQ